MTSFVRKAVDLLRTKTDLSVIKNNTYLRTQGHHSVVYKNTETVSIKGVILCSIQQVTYSLLNKLYQIHLQYIAERFTNEVVAC